MEVIKPQYVDIIIRGEENAVNKVAQEAGFSEFSVGSNDEGKYIFQIPTDWNGWTKSRVFELVDSKFSKEAYFGLSFVSIDDISVIDEKGEEIESFPVSHEGTAKSKWVKKKMILVKRIKDEAKDSKWLLISGWKFDGRYSPPMINFLDLKCLTSELSPKFGLADLLRSLP
jgi:hypothetical protein